MISRLNSKVIMILFSLIILFLVINLIKPNEVMFHQEGDFDNEEEGTIVFNVLLDTQLETDYIVFFKSNFIKGLRIAYDLKDLELQAGMPILKNEAHLFDNMKHQIAYTYKRDDNQVLYLDGEEIGRGEYKPGFISSFTGFVIAEESLQVPVEVRILDKQLSKEEIKELF